MTDFVDIVNTIRRMPEELAAEMRQRMVDAPEDVEREEARFFVQCADAAEKKPLFYIADIEYKAQTKETTEAVCVAFLDEVTGSNPVCSTKAIR